MSTAPPWVDTDDVPTQGDTGGPDSDGGDDGEWDPLGEAFPALDNFNDNVVNPFVQSAPILGGAYDVGEGANEFATDVGERLDGDGDGGDDSDGDRDLIDRLIGWIISNPDEALVAAAGVWLLSMVGPGLAETAQAAGGD